MNSVFNPKMGKVEIELHGTYVILLWVSFERPGKFRMFIVTAGGTESWEISEWLNTAEEKKEFILTQLAIPRFGPWSIQNTFQWSSIFDDAVRKALTEKVKALEVQENQLDDWIGLIQTES